MTDYGVRRLGLILAKQAEIEGMKSVNTTREINGQALPFGQEAFNDAAREIENIVYTPEELL